MHLISRIIISHVLILLYVKHFRAYVRVTALIPRKYIPCTPGYKGYSSRRTTDIYSLVPRIYIASCSGYIQPRAPDIYSLVPRIYTPHTTDIHPLVPRIFTHSHPGYSPPHTSIVPRIYTPLVPRNMALYQIQERPLQGLLQSGSLGILDCFVFQPRRFKCHGQLSGVRRGVRGTKGWYEGVSGVRRGVRGTKGCPGYEGGSGVRGGGPGYEGGVRGTRACPYKYI